LIGVLGEDGRWDLLGGVDCTWLDNGREWAEEGIWSVDSMLLGLREGIAEVVVREVLGWIRGAGEKGKREG